MEHIDVRLVTDAEGNRYAFPKQALDAARVDTPETIAPFRIDTPVTKKPGGRW